ncbi:family 78 glycoside hydrolase catalytic domain [Chitinophaga sp. Cy-1792]|uniref:family 78 glycoside hydrolase catalytic domain n=1 Tax=Chitinophaga sp. Cy-1792 TaxID=2608339 RepID=UPI001420DAA3|nr:family 78 glycoside hydrolase catalytic domain [Chitinophaga sp. Cy-1792]
MKQWWSYLLLLMISSPVLAQQPDTAIWKHARWIAYENIHDTAIIVPLVHGNGKKAWGPRKDILPLFRREFTVSKPLRHATAFVSGLGQYELTINGVKTGDNFLEPGWTDYRKASLYVTYDVTRQIGQGNNAIGMMLGNGFYYIPGQRYRKMTGGFGFPKMILRLQLEYADGSTEDIVSDENWKTTPSPIYFSSIYGGEDYDATLEQQGWDMPGFDARQWKRALVATPVPLVAQVGPSIHWAARWSNPRSWTSGKTTVYDFRQNTAGIPLISVWGNKGDTVRIRPAELINPDSTVYQQASGSPYYLTYILKGSTKDKPETWHPRFTYYGQRYMQVECIPVISGKLAPVVAEIINQSVTSAGPKIGSFRCSNELFNKTDSLIDHAITSNTVSVFTDCPHREKLGWLEQTYLMGPSVAYNYDVAAHNRKTVFDMQQAQYQDGKVPEIAPEFTQFTPPFDESPEWGSASVIVPWNNYRWYGDKATLAASYEMMQGYVAYLQGRSINNIISHGLGDWFDIGPERPGVSQMTKMGITATATYYYDLTIMVKVATLLKKKQDAAKYARQAVQVKAAFNKAFFDPVRLKYDSASQTANAMALYMDLVPAGKRNAVLNALITDIRTRNNALTAGDIGYRYVLQALQQSDKNDVIFDMNSRDDVPGYGFQIKHGATALTESWQAYEFVSNNHFMLGHLMEWFYAGVAGIQQSEESAGFRHIVIKPSPVGDLKWATCNYGSPSGTIVSNWEKTADAFNLTVEIPFGADAMICIPVKPGTTVTKNGERLKKVVVKNGRTLIPVSSGKYVFTVQ